MEPKQEEDWDGCLAEQVLAEDKHRLTEGEERPGCNPVKERSSKNVEQQRINHQNGQADAGTGERTGYRWVLVMNSASRVHIPPPKISRRQRNQDTVDCSRRGTTSAVTCARSSSPRSLCTRTSASTRKTVPAS